MNNGTFKWPNGKRAALSLTFDDARLSQVDAGLPLLDAHGVKATFYVMPDAVMQRLDGWRRAVANGHEIGNHTLTHPCSGNFPWARTRALEDFTLERMAAEMDDASHAIEKSLGVRPQTFAYPCGQTFVGRGAETKSYVPLVAQRFLAGRGYPNEAANDPARCDLAQLFGRGFDGLAFENVRPWIDETLAQGGWMILAGHEIGGTSPQTVSMKTLEAICDYAAANGVWVDTVFNTARHLVGAREK